MADKIPISLNKVYTSFMDLMFYPNDPVDLIDKCVVEDVMGYGTTLDEKIMGLKELKDLAVLQRDQSPDLKFSYELIPVFRKMIDEDGISIIVDEIRISMQIDGENVVLNVRMSTVWQLIERNWKLVHWHGSKPEYDSGGTDTWHKEEWSKKNEELQKQVNEKTADLEKKNRELEIESALERVQTVAMSMQKPDDIQDVCQIISEQLELLNVSNMRNVQVAVIDKLKKNYANYQYFSAYAKSVFEETKYETDPTANAMVQEMQKSANSFFIGSIKDDELKRFREWRSSNNQFPDPLLDEISAVYYYFYSIGEGGLGLTTYKEISKEDLEIFKRFYNVFTLAYRRFKDILQAEAQAREAQIEAALEKVRARAMSMQEPDELTEVAVLLRKEMGSLGVEELETSSIYLVGEDKTECWYAIKDVRKKRTKLVSDYMTLQLKDTWVGRKMEAFYHSKQNRTSIVMKGEYRKEWIKYSISKSSVFKGYQGEEIPERTYHLMKFSGGYMGAASPGEISGESWSLLQRSAIVFSLAYTRFKDLQQAAERTREAQIELALERVRARTMAMQSSDELPKVANVIYLQIQSLGIPTWSTNYNILSEDKKSCICIPSSEGQVQTSFHIPFEGEKSFMEWGTAIKNGDSFLLQELAGNDIKEHYEYLMSLPGVQAAVKPLEDAGISFPDYQINHLYFFRFGFLMFITYEKVSESHDIFKRFTAVFEQTYTRFLDLQKAEEQAREAQIEAALERVRSRSMAMRSSNELADLSFELVKQVHALGIETWFCAFNIYDEDHKGSLEWGSNAEGTYEEYRTPREGIFLRYYEAGQKGETLLINEIGENECPGHYDYLCSLPGVGEQLLAMKDAGISFPKSQIDHAAFFKYGYILFITFEPAPEAHDTFKRFAKVFEQTYTRFLDLQKAENQAWEAQIETALERVRSRSIGMQKSEELKEVIQIIFEQLTQLNINAEHAGIVVDYEARADWNFWVAEKQDIPSKITVPYLDSVWDRQYNEAKEKGKDFFTTQLNFEEKNSFYTELLKHIHGITKKARNFYLSCPGLAISTAIQKDVGLYIENFSGTPYSDEENAILKRFIKVFQQTYTRFLDLQKAEAQAREAQIEAALENIRSRSLAVTKSGEFNEVVDVVFKKFKELNISIDSVTISLRKKGTKDLEVYGCGSSETGITVINFQLPYFKNAFVDDALEAQNRSESGYYCKIYSEEDKDTYYEYALKNTELKNLPDDIKQRIRKSKTYALSVAHTKNSMIMLNEMDGNMLNEGDADILKRFSRVFEQAYVRFLDLQKAEEQAREAQVDAALERTRNHSMRMQHSDEIMDLSKIFHEQLISLNIPSEFSYIWLPEEEKEEHMFWATWSETKKGKTITNSKSVTYPLDKAEPYTAACFDAWESDIPVHVTKIPPEEITLFFTTWKDLLKGARNLKARNFPEGIYYAESYMKYGCFGINIRRPLTVEEQNILLRFTIEFERAYTRFLDLKKAEAQAREAQIEAALEKVRSRTMAMQKSIELPEAANNLFLEVQALGIPAWSAGYCIWEKGKKSATAFMSSEGVIQKSFSLPNIGEGYNFQEPMERGETFHVSELGGEEIKKHYEFMRTIPVFGEVIDGIMNAGFPLPTFQIFHIVYFNHGYLMFITYEPVPDAHDIFKRFSRVFEQTYTRFLDLKQAEEQARENQIELGLERIRAMVANMQNSEELLGIMVKMRAEFVSLGHEAHYFWHMKWEADKYLKAMTSGDGSEIGMVMELPRKIHGEIPSLAAWEKGDEPTVVHVMDVEATLDYIHKMATWGDFKRVDPNMPTEKDIHHIGGLTYVMARTLHGEIGYSLPGMVPNPPEDAKATLVRFAAVFDLAYRRFEDLKDAESRNRETQIELALERIRAKTMAMHKTSELQDVINTVHKQFESLNMDITGGAFIAINEEIDKEISCWGAGGTADYIQRVHIPFLNRPIYTGIIKGIEKGPGFFSEEYSADEKLEFFNHLFKNPPYNKTPEKQRKEVFGRKGGYARSCIVSKFTSVFIINHHGRKFSKADNEILKRFGKVFEQSYTRFLDLKKAEEQGKEARIEAALERIRAKAMSMHSSTELEEVAHVLREQMGELNQENLETSAIHLYPDNSDDIETWFALRSVAAKNKEIITGILNFKKDSAELVREMLSGYKSSKKDYTLEASGAKMIEFFEVLISGAPEIKKALGDDPAKLPSKVFYHFSDFSGGSLVTVSYSPPDEETKKLQQRSAKVFDLAYRRFLDLKLKEEQAREAQIETALERVRAKTMAMHNSQDVGNTVITLFDEVLKLGIDKSIRLGIGILAGYERMETWSANSNPKSEIVLKMGMLDMTIHPMLIGLKKAWESGEKDYRYDYRGEDVYRYYEALNREPDYPFQADLNALPENEYHRSFFHPEGTLFSFAPNPISEETAKVLERFAHVFGQTYRRYRDLLKAEKQAREAVKQASLDRIRGEIASMRTTNDLQQITPLIWRELITLEIPFFRCGIFIINEKKKNVEIYLTTPEGNSLGVLNLGFDSNEHTYNSVKSWRKGEVYQVQWTKEQFMEWTQEMIKLGQVETPEVYQGAAEPPDSLHLHFIPFAQGMLYIGNNDQLTEENIILVRSVAEAFSYAYARYEDFVVLEAAKQSVEKTLNELKDTQSQLIHSEKMASLGELTAGIAHEIQNPLNFVNNFSEVSVDLIEEMEEEIERGEVEEAKAITDDLKQNLEKINHHGKRASSIVKGMLEHSRAGDGMKEATDINALADEYLRLSYHGLRAKDKSFNANFETSFDDTLTEIHVIPQDISRVILNLINNAFFAVAEKGKNGIEGYSPTVYVSTKKLGNKVEIRIKDNGNGIPEKILDKIFQPFFTTKPTGQGTGLGLSLSFDIITKGHNGDLKVETQEGSFTEFIITLPEQKNK